MTRELIKKLFELTGYKNQVFFIEHGGAKYSCALKRMFKKRTIPQNRLYRLWLSILSEEITGDKTELVDELHERFKRKFLDWDKKSLAGFQDIYLPGSTTKLNTKEFTVYLEKIRVFSAEFLNCTLPLPEDKGIDELIEKERCLE